MKEIAIQGREQAVVLAGKKVVGALSRLRKAPLLPLAILAGVVLSAIFAPVIAPHDYAKYDLTLSLKPPFWQAGGDASYILGTDQMGRDILSRLIWGSRVSLMVGFMGIGVASSAGTVLGLISGYFGGWADTIIMRLVDIKMSVPSILLALVLCVTFGPGLGTVIAVIGIVYWVYYARLVRGETLTIRERDFVAIAKVVGSSRTTILLKHILPNVMNSLVVLITLQLGTVIIFEATLSFLGVGIQPPTPAWGSMLADGRVYLIVSWWIAMFPGIAIMLTVLACNLTGDWLRDTLDPKRRQL